MSSHLHRQVLAMFIYILETLAVIGFLITRPPMILLVIGAVIIIIGTLFFFLISRLGKALCDRIEAKQASEISTINRI